MPEQLMRIDAINVKENVYATIYTVPAGCVFVVSSIDTHKASTIKIRINWNKVIAQTNSEWSNTWFFKWLILNENDIVAVTHAYNWGVTETITMSWSLVTQILPN